MEQRSPLRQLWDHSGPHRGRVRLATTFSILNKAFDVMPELLIGLAVINVIVWVSESATDYVAHILWRNLAQSVEHDLRMEAYHHIQQLELAYFEDRTSGGLIATLNDDVNQLERFLDMGAHEIVITTFNVIFVGLIFAVISRQLMVLAFLPIPVIVVGSLM